MNDVYMDIETFVSPCLYENCYLCSFADFSFVVDPSIPYETLKKKSSKPIKYVLITHAHYDHINELNTYMNRGITFYIGKEDYNKLLDAHLNLSLYIIGKSWQVDLKNEKVILVTEKSYKLEEEELEVMKLKVTLMVLFLIVLVMHFLLVTSFLKMVLVEWTSQQEVLLICKSQSKK